MSQPIVEDFYDSSPESPSYLGNDGSSYSLAGWTVKEEEEEEEEQRGAGVCSSLARLPASKTRHGVGSPHVIYGYSIKCRIMITTTMLEHIFSVSEALNFVQKDRMFIKLKLRDLKNDILVKHPH